MLLTALKRHRKKKQISMRVILTMEGPNDVSFSSSQNR